MEQIEEFIKMRLEYIDKIMMDRTKLDYIKLIKYIKQLSSISLNSFNIIKLV